MEKFTIDQLISNLRGKSKPTEKNLTANSSDKDPNKERHANNDKSKEATNRISKILSVYRMYQKMNPRRIAGETEEQNIKNNLTMGRHVPTAQSRNKPKGQER